MDNSLHSVKIYIYIDVYMNLQDLLSIKFKLISAFQADDEDMPRNASLDLQERDNHPRIPRGRT